MLGFLFPLGFKGLKNLVKFTQLLSGACKI